MMNRDKGSAIADSPSPEACHWLMQTGLAAHGTPAPGGHQYVTKYKYTEEEVKNWECSYPLRRA